MQKLMTKVDFAVEDRSDGFYITVTRLLDGATKVFFIAGHATTAERISEFMCSVTDELADGYFPKPRKMK